MKTKNILIIAGLIMLPLFVSAQDSGVDRNTIYNSNKEQKKNIESTMDREVKKGIIFLSKKDKEELRKKLYKECPSLTGDQVASIVEKIDSFVMNQNGHIVDIEDIKCYSKAKLDIKILGVRRRVETKEFKNAIFFFFKDQQYDEGYSWFDWRVDVRDINTGSQLYLHDFDFNHPNDGDETDVITLTNLENTEDKNVYKSRLPF